MSSVRLETLYARLLTDDCLRHRFLEDPCAVAAEYGLNETEHEAVRQLDRIGLAFAARSIEAKKQHRRHQRGVHRAATEWFLLILRWSRNLAKSSPHTRESHNGPRSRE